MARSSSSDGRVGESLYARSTSRAVLPTDAAQDHELVVLLGVGHRHLRSGNRIIADSDAGRPLEQMRDACGRRSFQSAHGQTVLGDT